MSQPDRRDKIKALLSSAIMGEREAAKAALDRLAELDAPPPPPAHGTTEWHEAVQAWSRVLEFCDSRRGSPLLSQKEVTLIRNWARNRGTPWKAGADEIIRIQAKLAAADAVPQRMLEEYGR